MTDSPSPSPASDTGIVGETGHCTTSLTPSDPERSPGSWEGMDLAAGMRRPTRGSVSVSGLDAVEDSSARSSICLLGTRRGLLERAPVKDSVALWEATRPRWNRQDAEQYLDLFEVPVKGHRHACPRGSDQRSTLSSPWRATAQSCSWTRFSWAWMPW